MHFRNGLHCADKKRRNCDRRPSKLDFRNSQSPRICWDTKLFNYAEQDPKILSEPDPDLGWEMQKSHLEDPPIANPPLFLVRASAIGLHVRNIAKCEPKIAYAMICPPLQINTQSGLRYVSISVYSLEGRTEKKRKFGRRVGVVAPLLWCASCTFILHLG